MRLVTFRIQAKPDECARARVLAGLSCRQAATALKVSPTHLNYIETGKRQPSPSLLKRMAERYGVPMTSLFDEVPEEAA